MLGIRRAHTADLTREELRRIRAFLETAFGGEFTDADWEHTLGGVHVLVLGGDHVLGHAAVVQRRLVHGEVSLRTGYVEGVAIRVDLRGRGIGGELMDAAEAVVRAAYDLGGLSSGGRAARFYERRGWRRWEGPTWVLAPGGARRTVEEDGGVFVLETPTTPPLDPTGPLACDWRRGDAW